MTERNNFTFSLYQPGDERSVVSLFELAFPGRKMSLDYWNWRFQKNPNGHAVIMLAWSNEQLVGHCSASKVEILVYGEQYLTGLTGTAMTRPGYYNRGLFSSLNLELHRTIKAQNIPFVWSFPNNNSHRIHIEKVERVDIYEIPILALSLAEAKRRLPKPTGHVQPVGRFNTDFDKFWQAEKHKYAIISKRDSQTLQWRYVDHPSIKYKILAYKDENSQFRGYAVFKRYHNECQIVDILSETPEIGVDLIADVVKWAEEEQVDSIGLWLNVSHPLHRELEKLGFCNRGDITYFTGKILLPFLNSNSIYKYHNWYLTMGDSDVF